VRLAASTATTGAAPSPAITVARPSVVTRFAPAIKLANGESLKAIPPFVGELVLRDSVAPGPFSLS